LGRTKKGTSGLSRPKDQLYFILSVFIFCGEETRYAEKSMQNMEKGKKISAQTG